MASTPYYPDGRARKFGPLTGRIGNSPKLQTLVGGYIEVVRTKAGTLSGHR